MVKQRGPLADIAVLIPAWQPGPDLQPLVATLLQEDFGALVLVDDGSSVAYLQIFEALDALPRVHLLRHPANHGKGRSLKTGLSHIASALPHLRAAVTADADGQHSPADIVRVATHFAQSADRPVLGTRTFGPEVPWRSRLGNQLTRHAFRVATGTRLLDTQTGLRALPRRLFPELIALRGERYEYEIAVLAHLSRTGNTPNQLPIETIYLDSNRSSHFHPLWDSLRIYRTLLLPGSTSKGPAPQEAESSVPETLP